MKLNESFLLTVKLQLFDFLNCSFCSLHEKGKETMSIHYTTGTLHCLIICVTLQSDQSVWPQAAQHLPPFQCAVSWGPHVLVHCTAINIGYILTMFTEGTGNAFLWLADNGHTNKHVIHGTVFLYIWPWPQNLDCIHY